MNRKRLRKNKKRGRFLFTLLTLCILIFALYLLILTQSKTVIINPLSLKSFGQIEKVEKRLNAKNIPFSKIEEENDLSYKVSIKDNGIVFISERKDLAIQIDSLQLILSRLTIEGKRFKVLDFRFDKPVVSY
ncbi:MAG: hypothetical protein A2152_00430 [Candidatus Levybacteria bacterium RBG_16_35_6]|nr:MAG: hypothetical protein A2152_00430 [Candidatus Levybacteria bacterium RBG_16_35_6]